MTKKLVLLIILLGFFALGAWAVFEAERLRNYPITAWLSDHEADCAVALTGSPGRVDEGFSMLSRGQVKKLILTGVYPKAKLREVFPQWPYYGDLDERDVILEKRSKTTYGNAQQSLPLVEALKCGDVVLITSQLHMHRALRTFRRIFPEEIPIYARAIGYDKFPPAWNSVILETWKSMFYSIWTY